VKPGDKLPIKGVDFEVLAAAGEHASSALAGAGQPNSLCTSAEQRAVDPSENARSIGSMLTFGKFRFINLADLTWNKELELVCPNNLIGTVDLYLVTHHGMNLSGSPTIVHAIRPRVAVMNNGAKKGGSPEAWGDRQRLSGTPGILATALRSGQRQGKERARGLFANLEEKCEGHYIKISAQPNGTFTVTNSRNKLTRTYQPKGDLRQPHREQGRSYVSLD